MSTVSSRIRGGGWALARGLSLLMALALAGLSLPLAEPPAADAASGTYRNPLEVRIPEGGLVESCADPTLIRGQATGDAAWYMYCTTDPLNGDDRDAGGNFNFRLIPMLRSTDLVNWTYMGDAFDTRPSYAVPNAGLWAPDIQYIDGQYVLYYTVTDTTLPGGGSAIGAATSDSPLGPWTHANAPVVEPHDADCCPGAKRWVFDPEVIEANGQHYIYYGSYFGGLSVRTLSADGLTSDPASQTNVAIPNRYEGPEVVQHNGWFYMFVSATDCCRGPLTGYSVFVGRSHSPLGPFVDHEGNSFMEGRVGGLPSLTMNGNGWVGPGHNTVFEDFDGQWWTFYHAVDEDDPYFTGAVGFTKRPVLLDPIDWVDGWPLVRAGQFISAEPIHRPAAQPGERSRYRTLNPLVHNARQLLDGDEFDGSTLDSGWSWVRERPPDSYSVADGVLSLPTESADLHENQNSASVLHRPLPEGNWLVETRMRIDLPAEGCCFNFAQAGLVVYGDDDNYLKLVHVSIWETRQTEWAKEVGPVAPGFPRYGNTVVSAPAEWTWLRIARWERDDKAHYQAYVSQDGASWTRGGVWTHELDEPSIGLVAMGGAGFTAQFEYVRVHRLQVQGSRP